MAALIKTPHIGFDRYWSLVDTQLLALREKDETAITRYASFAVNSAHVLELMLRMMYISQLTAYLQNDLSAYGRIPLPSAVIDTHETQQVVELAVVGELEDNADD